MWRSPSGMFEVTGWVQNITNTPYRVQSFDITDRSYGLVLDVYSQPRTYGLTVTTFFQ